MKTMCSKLLLSGFTLISLLFSGLIFGQNNHNQIPETHLKHPELGVYSHNSPMHEVAYEMIHERTAYSRTFLNTNGTKSRVQSSSALHYLAENGFWLTREYIVAQIGNSLVYPKQDHEFELNKTNGTTTVVSSSGNMVLGANKSIRFLDDNGQVVQAITAHVGGYSAHGSTVSSAIASGIEWQQTFFNGALKFDYVLRNKNLWPANFSVMSFEEDMQLPHGFTLEHELENGRRTERILVKNQFGAIIFIFHQPVLSDSKAIEKKFRHSNQSKLGRYEIQAIGQSRFRLKLTVDGTWLNNAEREFPIIIDPVVTVQNTNVVNSCFFPSYQQSTMSVNVPAGETIFSTDFSYDFVATSGTQAWMSDQQSFIVGPSGQTPVFSGEGDQGGVFTYNIPSSTVANGLSAGTVNYTFNFARTWGGSGCNATYNFVNRREITVHYGTLEFGNGPVFINEYSASNRSFSDGFNRFEDWIEIYNAHSTGFFDLSGYYLSNDASNPTMWQVANGFIPPNSRIIIWCSKRNISSGMVQHTNFNLTQLRPDQIVFSDPNGNVLEQYEMFVTQTNHSYGRLTDGAEQWGVFSNASPGQANTNGAQTYAQKPVFNLESGHYNETLTVQLSVNSSEQIRYTLNGSTPTASSALYTGPIVISQTTVIRARAFSTDPNVLPGFIETNTYLINENHSLPIFSFAGDADLMQLFGGNAALRPIGNFEYFDKNGVFIDENLGDFDKHGNDSWNYPQRGVDFVSRDDHGYKRRLEHKFFATSERTRFRRLMVKAAANDNYPHQNGGAHIRDSYIQTLSQLAGLDLDERSSTNVILYVNGQYWGVYDLRERVDDNNFTEHYYNQDYLYRDSDVFLQFLKTWGATQAHFGNQPAINDWNALRSFIQGNNMGNPSNFDYVNSQLNIESLIDYFVLNSFVVARDWLNYNTGWWRGTNPDGDAQQWRYIVWDMEASTGHFTNYTGMPNVSATAPPCQVENLNVGNGHAQSLNKLINENPAVRQMYVTRYIDLMNTAFSCANITHVLDSMVANIALEMPRQISRWGGNMETWQSNVQALRTFMTTRCNHMMTTGLASCYNLSGPFATTFDVYPAQAGNIKMNSIWLNNYPFAAQLFGNIQTNLQVEASPGYAFSHWVVDGAVVTPDLFTPAIAMQISQATSITAHFIDLSFPDDALIYYWHFNDLVTPQDVTTIPANYKLIQTANPIMTYTGSGPRDIDAVNSGTLLNIHQGEIEGRSARVRNPSEGRSLVFDLPTNGYRDIKFAYAVERTNQGMLKNIISYSLDGVNFTQANLAEFEFNITPEYQIVFLNFTSISGVNNNPNFKVKIEFQGNTTTSNGNNRFDNITLKGVDIFSGLDQNAITEVQLFPNPTNQIVHLRSNRSMFSVEVIDLSGKMIQSYDAEMATEKELDFGALHSGVYLLRVYTSNGIYTLRVVKQ
jgi:hypothetical protein